AEMKKLYRQLARRFHPDTAVDETDRTYRTQLMMAVNAAYAAGDIQKLHELADSPETNHQLDYSHADQKLAETLLREVTRIKRRLAEIKQEVSRLEKHESAKLMKKMALAEADGRDYLAELEKQMRDLLVERLAQRDSLQVQVESVEMGEGADVSDEDFADLVWDVSMETAFEEEIPPEFDRYIQRRRDRVYFEEDFDDDYDYE
ncbi:MAG TPA: J domain-containing protein, partial [Chloroflexota bacterium]|nr:J domain-containing protein [Chloroflexota bacterium]